jgi:hypothetical protein
MRCLGLIVVVGSLLACNVGLSQGPVVKDGSAKLEMCSGLPCVEVTVDTQKLHFAIDTAHPHSVVDASLILNEGLDTEPYTGPNRKAFVASKQSVLPGLKIGGIEIKDLPVLVTDLQTPAAGNTIPDVDGFLGYEAFKGKTLEMNLKKNTISVSDSSSCSGGTLKLIPFGKSGAMTVTTTGFDVDGKPVVAQVNTLFAGSMLVYPDSVAKLGLTDVAKTRQKENFPFTDGGVNLLTATAKESFGDKELGDDVFFLTPGVLAPGGVFNATVGYKLLADHTVIFDFGGGCFQVL